MELVTRQLSDRERTVLLLAADGLTDKQIASHLQLSQRTIGTYWERMRQKMGQYSRTQLVANFVRGIVQADESTNYRNLFASWQEGVWILLETGETVYANHQIADLFGIEFSRVRENECQELGRERGIDDP